MRIWLFFALAAAGAAPAHAQLTASYVSKGGGTEMNVKLEIAPNGDIRADMGAPGLYLVKREGRTYFIMPDSAGPVVADVADMGAVIQEQMNKAGANLCAGLAKAPPSERLVSRGTVTVVGRTGEAYAREGRSGSAPDVVISRDPALAPLGVAMAAQFRTSLALLGECAAAVPLFVQMQGLLDGGAPLEFGPIRLDTVQAGPVDAARFVLPAATATRDQVRALMARKDGPAVRVEVRPPN
jgi:hypothetical protein